MSIPGQPTCLCRKHYLELYSRRIYQTDLCINVDAMVTEDAEAGLRLKLHAVHNSLEPGGWLGPGVLDTRPTDDRQVQGIAAVIVPVNGRAIGWLISVKKDAFNHFSWNKASKMCVSVHFSQVRIKTNVCYNASQCKHWCCLSHTCVS